MIKFTIPGRLPGMNEIITASGQHWAKWHKQKKEAKELVQLFALAARIKPINGRAAITITCYEPNRRRDIDNVQSGAGKIILDALQDLGILKGDGQKYISRVDYEVEVDKQNPRVEVEIKEME